mmetsp:Transcript_10648/g.14928  ORF Transcript_10648/g.14928 Transcript_10648/m.14928 type:complete len:96 (+) Transcript_10648:3-290(+)
MKEFGKAYGKWKNHKSWVRVVMLKKQFEGGDIFYNFLIEFLSDAGVKAYSDWIINFEGKREMKQYLIEKRAYCYCMLCCDGDKWKAKELMKSLMP